MNTSTFRVLIACLWIASAAGAYFLGRQAAAPRGGAAVSGAPAASGNTADGSGAMPGPEARGGGARQETQGERLPVKDAILQARAALGSGMGAFMNMRAMFRAFAPLAELTDAEVQLALAEVEQTVKEPQQKMMFYSMLLSQWAETDGPAAMAYAKEKLKGQGPLMSGITMSVVGTWARRDPEAVWRWYLDAREKGERSPMGGTEGYLAGIFNGMASANVDAALGRLGTLADHERQQAIQGIAMSGMEPRTREGILARAPSLDPQLRATLYQGLVGSWMMTDADGATKWLSTLPADEKKPLVATAGSTLMFMNPEKGAELQLQSVEEKDLPQTYSRIAMQWANRDPQAAGDWLNKQPQGPQLDEARRSFAVAVAGRDAAGAFDWVKAIQDESKQLDGYRAVYKSLSTKNPASADAALDGAGLPPEIAAKVRDSMKPKPAEGTPQ